VEGAKKERNGTGKEEVSKVLNKFARKKQKKKRNLKK